MTIVFLMFLVNSTSFANSLENLKQCAEKKDSLVRLVCYDHAVKLLNNVESPNIKKPASVHTLAKAKKEADIVNVQPQVEVANKADHFGSEYLASDSKSRPVELDHVVFTVKSAKKVVHNKWKIIFNNEQVWKQSSSEYIKLAAGDRVELSKGAFGSYQLKKLDSNRSIRVKRTK